MAKPTGAKVQSDYGVDITSATELDPLQLYHAFPLYRQAAYWSDLGLTSGMVANIRIRRLVGTDTTLRGVFSVGHPNSGEFSESAGASAMTTSVSTSQPPSAAFLNAAGNPEIVIGFWWVPVSLKLWCESTGTGPNTTELEAVEFDFRPDAALGSGFGYTSTPHQTAADRLYVANRALTAYHMRKLIASTYNAMLYSCGLHRTLPLYGTFA